MSQIATEAGFSKGALYWNFASKEDLFFALLDQTDEQLRVLLSLISTAPSDSEISPELSRNLSRVLDQQRDTVLVFHEYSALAVRDPELAVIAARQQARRVTRREGKIPRCPRRTTLPSGSTRHSTRPCKRRGR